MRGESLPLSALVVSAVGHLLVLGAIVFLASLWAQRDQSKVYIVNLVSGIPSLGRVSEAPRPPETPSLPARQTVSPPAVRETPPDARDRQETVRRSEPSMPPARRPTAPSLPRPGEKELPRLSHSSLPERRAIATAPLGRPTGSPTVAANSSISLDVGDFPFTWYLRQMLQKVEERWHSQPPMARPDQPPVVVVEILRNGSITPPKLEKSSGNSLYDRAALRAVQDASPFPPLPPEWSKPSLRVGLGFELSKERG